MLEVFSISNSSIAGIFRASLVVFLIPFILEDRKKKVALVWFCIALPLIYLVLFSNSRASWLGFVLSVLYAASCYFRIKKKRIALIISLFILFVLFLLIYKADSSRGRKHIYDISLAMLNNNWVGGSGVGKFKAKFNEYQADYFTQNNIDSKRALLADNSFYAFNDYLQWIIEAGIIGFLILGVVLYFTASRIICLHRENFKKSIVVSATASLICIGVAALFSYPLQIIPIQAVVLICLAIIAFYPERKNNISTRRKLVAFSYRGFVILLAAVFICNTWNECKRKQMEKDAFELVLSGYKTEAISKYKLLVEKYPKTGYNWFLYAQQLYYSNRLAEAKESLDRCRLHYVDNKVYKLKADIEQELKMYPEAEKSYLRTIYMVPNRMGSRFDLLNFNIARNDTTKTVYWAKSILNMPIKVPSAKVDNMLLQTKSIIEKLEKLKLDY